MIHLKNNVETFEILTSDEHVGFQEALANQLIFEKQARFRATVVDPPFASFAREAEKAMHRVAEMLDELGEAYESWTQHISEYGFADGPPERMLAVILWVVIRADFCAKFLSYPDEIPSQADVARWLMGHQLAMDIVRRMLNYATCTFPSGDQRLDAIERLFVRSTFANLYEEIEQEPRIHKPFSRGGE